MEIRAIISCENSNNFSTTQSSSESSFVYLFIFTVRELLRQLTFMKEKSGLNLFGKQV